MRSQELGKVFRSSPSSIEQTKRDPEESRATWLIKIRHEYSEERLDNEICSAHLSVSEPLFYALDFIKNISAGSFMYVHLFDKSAMI